MDNLLKIDLSYSSYHTVFPKFVIYLLIILGMVLIIKNVISKIKLKNTNIEDNIEKRVNVKEKFNIKMFIGSIILLIIYGFALEWFGFISTTIIFIILSTLLYIGSINRKAFLISISNAVVTTSIIYIVFGKLFDITLP